jgi:hypothetical protein
MKMRKSGCCLALLVVSGVMLGCAANGKVVDFDKNVTAVSRMSLPGDGLLQVYDGNGLIRVSLRKIRTIHVSNVETRMYDKKLFVLAEINFQDGTRLGSLKSDKQKAYVAADTYVRGKIPGGTFEILLGNVSRVEIEK